MYDDLSGLKPGDRVGVIVPDYSRETNYRIDTVKEITPTGQIVLEGGKQFNPRGFERGEYGQVWRAKEAIVLLTPEIEVKVHRRNLVGRLKSKFSGCSKIPDSLSNRAVLSILEIIDSDKGHEGGE